MRTKRPGFGYCLKCGRREALDIIRARRVCRDCEPPVLTPLPDQLYKDDVAEALGVFDRAGMPKEARDAFARLVRPLNARPAGRWVCGGCGAQFLQVETAVSNTAPGWRTRLAELLTAPCRECWQAAAAVPAEACPTSRPEVS